ncbi:hypothetical protein T4B_3105 [Trichinella pseudospiralis]|uniref:Uncharacterized protein n=1 Tax=Trichinella pseudospiralis TaxID=6337 RepID=A0A0V1IFU9_TRIPS|nr:hypothetical protein T4B_3105 [Trichinella pseudospiralis]
MKSTLNGKYSSLSNLVKVYSFVKDVTDSTCALFCTSQKLLICKEEFMFMIVELLPSSVAIGISMEEKYRTEFCMPMQYHYCYIIAFEFFSRICILSSYNTESAGLIDM